MKVMYKNKQLFKSNSSIYSIEEYDTVNGDHSWHVRKHANGYIEMFGKIKTIAISNTTFTQQPSGVLVRDYTSPTVALPVALKLRYTIQFSIGDSSLSPSFWAYDTTSYNELTQVPSLCFFMANKYSGSTIYEYVNWMVTGTWN